MSSYIPQKGDYFRVRYLTNLPKLNINDYPVEHRITINNVNRERDSVINRDDDKIYYCGGTDTSIVLGEEFFSDGIGFINEDVGSYYLVKTELDGMRIPNNEEYMLRRLKPKLFIFKNKITQYEPVGPEIINALFKRIPLNDQDKRILYPEMKIDESELTSTEQSDAITNNKNVEIAKRMLTEIGFPPNFIFQPTAGVDYSNRNQTYQHQLQSIDFKKNPLPQPSDGKSFL